MCILAGFLFNKTFTNIEDFVATRCGRSFDVVHSAYVHEHVLVDIIKKKKCIMSTLLIGTLEKKKLKTVIT